MNIHPSWNDLLSGQEVTLMIRVGELARDFADEAPENTYFSLETVCADVNIDLLRVSGCTARLDDGQNALDTTDIENRGCLVCAIGWAAKQGAVPRNNDTHPVFRHLRLGRSPNNPQTPQERRELLLHFIWDMLYDGDWVEVDNTPRGVWQRTVWLIEDGVPSDLFRRYAEDPVTLTNILVIARKVCAEKRPQYPLDIRTWIEQGEIREYQTQKP